MSLLARSLQKKANIPARLYSDNVPYQVINGHLVPYNDSQNNYLVKGYNVNDAIYSIVKLIVDKVRVSPGGLYKVEDETAYKTLQAYKSKKELTPREYATCLSLQKKALVPYPNPGKWGDLIKYPNSQETWCDFIAAGVLYKLLTGNKYIWAELISQGANTGTPIELRLMPSQYMEIIATGIFPKTVLGYSLNLIPSSKYSPAEVLHEKYANPNFSIDGQELYGMSPLKAGLLRLKKNNSLTQAEASTFQNEGIKGLMFMKNQIGQVDGEIAAGEVRALKEMMMREWVGEHNRGRIGLAGFDMGYIPIGLTSQEMQVIESLMLDLRFFCNLYSVPSQLLNDPLNKTYNTVKESERALTSRCALPELKSTYDNLNRKGKAWGLPKGAVLDFDMSVYPELQADVKDVAEWTSKLIAISPNEQRELTGLGALDEPEMSEPWILSSGRAPLSDFQMNEVDEALDNENDMEDDPSEDS